MQIESSLFVVTAMNSAVYWVYIRDRATTAAYLKEIESGDRGMWDYCDIQYFCSIMTPIMTRSKGATWRI